jgi:hypothetical protein
MRKRVEKGKGRGVDLEYLKGSKRVVGWVDVGIHIWYL